VVKWESPKLPARSQAVEDKLLELPLAQGEYRVPSGPFSNHGTLGSGGWNTLS